MKTSCEQQKEGKRCVVFALDLAYPWVGAVHEGLCLAVEAAGWRVLLTSHRGRPLLEVEAVLKGEGPVVDGWVVADVGLALACRRRGWACVLLGQPPKPDGGARISSVWTDYRALGAMAAAELADRGYSTIGVAGLGETVSPAAWLKAEGARAFAKARGARWVDGPVAAGGETWLGERAVSRLANWMRTLPAPAGLVAINVETAWGLARAAQRAGRRVPEELGLIAAGEDPVLLAQAEPPLSGVAENGREIGARAAARLAALMAGAQVVGGHEVVPPRAVVRRGSTDYFAQSDPVVARALERIWRPTEGRLDMRTVAAAAHVSRATLLRRFVAARGHAPSEEIRRAKLARALALIRETDLPLAEVSETAGFGLQSALSRAVRSATGKTPSEWRQGRSKAS